MSRNIAVSTFDPDQIEMLLEGLMHLEAAHALAVLPVQLAPGRLDDHAGVAQALLDLRHNCPAMFRIRG